MYKIIGKVLASQAEKLHFSCAEVLQEVISLDNLKSPFVSVYVLSEVINTSPIIQIAIKNEGEWQECTDIIFGHLMKIK